jgi:hypothetical protein
MGHMFNDDILYHVLQRALENRNKPLTHRAQREALYTYALVSRMWARAAQSLLFRHVFLQIRTAMLAFLDVVDHKTERGRRLASYVRVATIKLSRERESSDPPSLPMLHPRHLPALLAHLPSLHELRLRAGQEPFGEKVLAAMKGLSSIRVLTLSIAPRSYLQPYGMLKVIGHWGGLQSLVLDVQFEEPGTLPPPCFALREFHEPTSLKCASPETLQWMLKHSVGRLEHCTLSFIMSADELRTGLSGHFHTIRSLTLGTVQWDEEACSALCSFTNLIELRIVQSIILMGPRFPGKLPNTLQHLTFAIPAHQNTASAHKNIDFMNTIPTQLKTYTSIYREAIRIGEEKFYLWAMGYEQACKYMGTEVRLIFEYAGELRFPKPSKVPRRLPLAQRRG